MNELWAVKGAKGEVFAWTITVLGPNSARTRFMTGIASNDLWEKYEARGYKVVRVRVEEEEEQG